MKTRQIVDVVQASSEQPCTSKTLAGHVALVTGASSGIGRSIALALSNQGAQVCIVGRDAGKLAETAAAVKQHSLLTQFALDLTVEEDLPPLLRYIEKEIGRLDILVHSAGVIHLDPMEQARIEDFDVQYATNVRVPYLITQRLLPLLIRARGQVVFINSSVGLTAKRPEIGQYSATKHALKAVADSLREEVNSKGIRVLTMYLGRTATPMQQTIFRNEGRFYDPKALLQPRDIAAVLIQALMLPPTAEVTEISIRPMRTSQ